MSGKQPDLSTPWSDWIWSENHDFKYATRTGPTGELEYDYLDPEEIQETPRGTADWTPKETSYAYDVNSSPETRPQYTTGAAPKSNQVATTKYQLKSPAGIGPSTVGASSLTTSLKSMSLTSSSALPDIEVLPFEGGTSKMAKQITVQEVEDRSPPGGLNDQYAVVDERKSKKFWKPGRVFMTPWTEPARQSAKVPEGTKGSHYSTVWLGELVHSEIRRFVVIGDGWGNVICSPIHSYSGRATLKDNLPDPEQHAIIHTSSKPPAELCEYDSKGYVVAREELHKDPIRVIRETNDPEGDLGDRSRINYAKIYTVEKYVRILNIGRVHEDSMESLMASCFFARPEEEPPKGPRKPRTKDNRDRRDDDRDTRRDDDRHKRGGHSDRRADPGQSSKTSHHHRKKH